MSSFVYYEASVAVEVMDDGTVNCPVLMLNGDVSPTIVIDHDGAPGGLVEIDDQHPEWDRLFDSALSMVPDNTYDLTSIFGGIKPGEGYPAYHMDDPRSNG